MVIAKAKCPRQKQIAHGKSKSLTAKANHSRQKQIHSRQKQITHGKNKSTGMFQRYVYPAEYANLGWSLFIYRELMTFIRSFTVYRSISGFGRC